MLFLILFQVLLLREQIDKVGFSTNKEQIKEILEIQRKKGYESKKCNNLWFNP